MMRMPAAWRLPGQGESSGRVLGCGRLSPCRLLWPVGCWGRVYHLFSVLPSAGLQVVGPKARVL